MSLQTLLEVASAAGIVVNVVLTLHIKSAVLGVKLWTTEHFMTKADARNMISNYLSNIHLARDK